jgi:hypothetical protein
VAGLETILKAADLIADIRKAYAKLENLEQGQRQLADALAALDRRVRELEGGLRETRAEIRLEAVKETQAIVNGVQGQHYEELRRLAIQVDRIAQATAGAPIEADETGPVAEGRRSHTRRASDE